MRLKFPRGGIPFLVSFGLFVSLLFPWWLVADWYWQSLIAVQREKTNSVLVLYGKSLQNNLSQRTELLKGLNSFVELQMKSYGVVSREDFQIFASGMFSRSNGVRIIILSPDGINKYVYPPYGFEKLIDRNIFEDEYEQPRADIQKAIQTYQTSITGPFIFYNGDKLIGAQQAVYQEDGLWGIATIMIDYPKLLVDSGISEASNILNLSIREKNGKVFYGDADVFNNSPVLFDLDINGNTWTLGGIPQNGWEQTVHTPMLTFSYLSLAGIFLICVVVFVITNRQIYLTNAVQRRTVEIELTRSSLQEEHDLLEQVMATSPAGIILCDLNGIIVFYNQRAKEILKDFDLETHENNIHLWKYTTLDGKPVEGIESPFEYVLHHELPVYGRLVRLEGDAGFSIPLFVNSAPSFDTKGVLSGVVFAMEDITEQQKADEILRKYAQELSQRVEERTAALTLANAQLERAARLKDEFLANVSHELRTPLSGILGLSEALQCGVYGSLTDKQNSTVHNIEESGRNLLTLINELLDLSKIEAGKFELELRKVSVPDLIQSCVRLLKQPIQKKKQKLILELDPEIDIVVADERRLKQILVNLLGNANKFTPENEELGIVVKGYPEAGCLKFVVWDHGIGFKVEDSKALFQPFVQLDSGLSRRYGGTGLGLPLVLRLVELHGGGIQVDSEPGKGSRFIISLPWQQAKMNAIQQPLKGMCVLVAENNENAAQILKSGLEQAGYHVLVAKNGVELVELSRHEYVDLAMIDLEMPVMNGFEAAACLKREVKTSSIPLVGMTAFLDEEEKQHCLEVGFSAYLQKPVDLDVFAEMVSIFSNIISN
jgi:signal transduction histidine kinase/CheY-like chemotaxis protein/sensor domain CHASE-containing protein